VARNPYKGLRAMALGLNPADVGVVTTSDSPQVFGVVMDMGMSPGTATIVALADGTTSMYTSSGGGTIGAGQHQSVADATRNLISVAQANLQYFDGKHSDKLPKSEHTSITILTTVGTKSLAAATNDFGYRRIPGSDVFHAANDVITQLRMLRS
jgi:hypothetical protein